MSWPIPFCLAYLRGASAGAVLVITRIGGWLGELTLPLSAVPGAILFCGGDILSRMLIKDQELPVGIITAGVGGFFIIVMLMRRTSGAIR